MCALLPEVGQLGILTALKDTGITNWYFWKLHNAESNNTSPLALSPQCTQDS